MKLKIRKLLGFVAHIFYPNFSTCGRCGRPWNICEPHRTPYSKTSWCFPLCQDCWSELTPEERLPYYNELILSWMAYGYPDKNGQSWDELRATLMKSVLDGK